MPGSFIDILPPEAQSLLGGIALIVALLGLIVWAAGVKIARFSVAVLLGAAVAAIGTWLLPKFLGVAPITGALVGFAGGAITGAIGFRLLQGLTLALCLGLAVGGMYYRWHILPALATSSPPTLTTATAPIGDDLIHLDALPAALPGTATLPATRTAQLSPLLSLGQSLIDRWSAIPPLHQKRLLIVSIGSAAIALLIAFGFARRTTWCTSALLGALLLMAGLNALIYVYAPQYEAQLPSQAKYRYFVLAVLTPSGHGRAAALLLAGKATGPVQGHPNHRQAYHSCHALILRHAPFPLYDHRATSCISGKKFQPILQSEQPVVFTPKRFCVLCLRFEFVGGHAAP